MKKCIKGKKLSYKEIQSLPNLTLLWIEDLEENLFCFGKLNANQNKIFIEDDDLDYFYAIHEDLIDLIECDILSIYKVDKIYEEIDPIEVWRMGKEHTVSIIQKLAIEICTLKGVKPTEENISDVLIYLNCLQEKK